MISSAGIVPHEPSGDGQGQWDLLRGTLLRMIQYGREDEYFIFERDVQTTTGSAPYVQFILGPRDEVRAEVASNGFRDPAYALAADQIEVLVHVGWIRPAAEPAEQPDNFTWDGHRSEPEAAADLLIRTLREVDGIALPAELHFDGARPYDWPSLDEVHVRAGRSEPSAQPRLGNPTASERRRWRNRGFDDAQVRAWRQAGCTPSEASEFSDRGIDARDVIAWFAEHVDSPRLIADLRTEGVPPEEIRAWRRIEVSPWDLVQWRRAFGTPEAAGPWALVARRWGQGYPEATPAQLASCPVSPAETLTWLDAGISLGHIPTLAQAMDLETAVQAPNRLGLRYANLVEALTAGMSYEQLEALAADYSGDELAAWTRSGLPPDSWAAWREAGFDPRAAAAFREATGIDDPSQALEWRNTGLSVATIADYRAQGLSPAGALEATKSGLQPEDYTTVVKGGVLPPRRLWTDAFARPRGRAPVFALHQRLDPDLRRRVQRALSDLNAPREVWTSLYSPAYSGQAFLDGGWAALRPYGLMGPPRDWIVGLHALGLLCHRMRLELPRRGRFTQLPDPSELERAWETQLVSHRELLTDRAKQLTVGTRPELEELASLWQPNPPA